MSEYTKEQEAEALAHFGTPPEWFGHRIRIVLAMAKRTAEAETRADASEADAKRLADDWAAVLLERDALRAQLEAVTRERDDLKSERDDLTRRLDGLLDERRLVALELGCGLQVPLPGRLADVAKHYVSQVREGEARLTRERDEARAFAADRETLALELDAARETIQHGIELRKQVERERDAARESEARMRAALEGLLRRVDDGSDYSPGHAVSVARAAISAPVPEPLERMMRVAEAVRAHVAHHIRTSPRFEGQLTAPADGGLLGRVAQDIENFDLRAIVAKVKP